VQWRLENPHCDHSGYAAVSIGEDNAEMLLGGLDEWRPGVGTVAAGFSETSRPTSDSSATSSSIPALSRCL
jgi:hypothetical protein